MQLRFLHVPSRTRLSYLLPRTFSNKSVTHFGATKSNRITPHPIPSPIKGWNVPHHFCLVGSYPQQLRQTTVKCERGSVVIIINIISFMQGIYTYIPETNCVTREYSVAAVLLLLFMVLISLVPVLNLLYFRIRTFRSVCAVPNMAVFWSSLASRFPGMLLTYFLSDFETVPVAPIITGITFVFTFHVCCISIVRSLYFRIIGFFYNQISISCDCNVY